MAVTTGLLSFLNNTSFNLPELAMESGTDFGTGGEVETFGNFAKNLLRKWSGSALTDAQIQANQFSAHQAQINRDFEERMSNTAYQRGVADMQAAGLNPALMYGSGSAASTPSGSAPSSASDTSGGLDFGSLVSALMLPMQLKQMRANIANTEATTKNTEARTQGEQLNNEFNERSLDARVRSVELSNNLQEAQRKQIDENLPLIRQNLAKAIEETKNESLRSDLIHWQTMLEKANAEQVAALLPYQQLLLSAQTDAQKASALSSVIHAAYEQHMLDSGYIEQQIDSLRKQATAAIMSASASMKSAEAQSALAGVNTALLDFKRSVYTGSVFNPDEYQGASKYLAKGMNALIGATSTITTAIAGPLSGLLK